MSADRKTQLNNSACEIIDYFSSKNVEAYIIDSTGKADFELFESQRIYIERVNYGTIDYFWLFEVFVFRKEGHTTTLKKRKL